MENKIKFKTRFTEFLLYLIGLLFIPGYLIFKIIKWIYYKFDLYNRFEIEYKINKFNTWLESKNEKFKDIHQTGDEFY